ncbi:hypothetical protein ZHAS_00017683 [Anopheles sinensis]|uniref:Uncharacterized protein n=1 Tax=Anopheles sinensis TaxID=74873 RepID=A0A084WGY8_ANOSI|nr:hypothetical protein ZHAS_00017683 [Anopheles sinensis]
MASGRAGTSGGGERDAVGNAWTQKRRQVRRRSSGSFVKKLAGSRSGEANVMVKKKPEQFASHFALKEG